MFVRSKKLVAGDLVIFLRGENGELRVGVRRLLRQLSNMPSSVITNESMRRGALATASYAIETGRLFSVSYKPRTRRSKFIVSVNKYLEARNHKLPVGMRFKRRLDFSGEEVTERRLSGTIVGVGDNNTSSERVLPLELMPLVAATPSNSQDAQRIEHAQTPVLPSQSLDLSLSVIGMASLPTPLLEESISSMAPSPDLSTLGMAALSTPLQEESICSESICSN